VRRLGANLFIEHSRAVDAAFVPVVVLVFLKATGGKHFDAELSATLRGQLYGSLAATSGALLGFVLAALAILVALPSGERIQVLCSHHSWPRVPGSYFRAAAGLLAALVICTLGIALDAETKPWVLWEAVTVGILAYSLARIIGAIFALDTVLTVSQQDAPLQPGRIDDPGP